MAIKGSLKEASLPDVIQLLFLGRRPAVWRWPTGTTSARSTSTKGRSSTLDREPARPAGRHAGPERPDHAGAAPAGHRRQQEDDREHKLGEILVELGALSRGRAGGLHAPPDRGGRLLPVHLDLGDLQLRGRRPARARGLPGAHQPRVAAARGRAAGGRVEPHREEDPDVRSHLHSRPGPHRRIGADAHRRSSSGSLPLLDGTRDVQQVIEESGLVEFEVGKALYGLITAGLRPPGRHVRRGRRRRSTTAGSRSTATSASPSTRPAMLDEALREFRRVADLRPTDASAPFFLGLIALRQARWEEAVEAFRQAIETGGAKAGGAAQPGVRPRAARPAGRGRGGLRRRRRPGAGGRADHAGLEHRRAQAGRFTRWPQGRLARARELLNGKPAPALWYWAATLASAGLDDDAAALEAARAGAAAFPGSAVLQNNLAVLLELSGDVAGAETVLRAALAEDPVAAAGLQEPGRHPLPQRPLRRGARGLRARGQARPGSGRRPVLQARQHRLQEAGSRPGPGELGPGDRAQSRARARQGQPRDAGLRAVTATMTRASPRSPARSRGGRGSRWMPTRTSASAGASRCGCGRAASTAYADYQALLDRSPAEYERLQDALTINVTRFYRNAETWNLLRARLCRRSASGTTGDVRAWSAGCSSGEEPYTLACSSPTTSQQVGRSYRLDRRHDRRDRHRPRQPRAGPGGALPAEALAEMPGDLVRRYFEPVGHERQVIERVRRRVQVRAPRPQRAAATAARTTTSSSAATW